MTQQPPPGDTARRHRRAVLAPALALVGLWSASLPGLGDRLFPDSAAYAAIAEHHLAGRWEAAINTYWSPLLSWLWALPLGLGAEVGTAAALGGLLSGGLALWGLHRLLRPATLPPWAAGATLLTAVPLLVYAGSMATPDLLLAGLLLLWVAGLRDPALLRTRRSAIATGLAAGAAHLAKLYALPIVLTLGPLLLLLDLRSRRASPRVVLRGHATALATFLLVVAAWTTVLSVSSGSFTVGTVGSVNAEVAAADSPGSPVYTEGLIPPPHPAARNAWEDPGALPSPAAGSTDGGGAGASSALQAAGDLAVRRVETAVANIARLVEEVSAWRFLLLLAVASHVWLLTGWHVSAAEQRTAAALLLFAAVFTGGLVLVHVEERYLWCSILALVPGTAMGLGGLARASVAVLADRLPGAPVRQEVRERAAALAVPLALLLGLGLPGGNAIAAVWGEGTAIRELAEEMDRDLGLSGTRVASDSAWAEMTLLCLHAQCRYYGLTSPEDHPDWRAQLARYAVEHYARWGEAEASPPAGARSYLTERWSGAVTRVTVHPVASLLR